MVGNNEMGKFRELDNIDISLYLIYSEIEKIMYEIENDYEDIFQSITVNEFRRYIKERYYLQEK